MSTYVVKLGGHALDSLEPDAAILVALASDLAELEHQGHQTLVVHGGGPQIQALLDAVGLESRFVEGLRVTDEVTMEYVAMGLSQVNAHVVAALNQSRLVSAGLSGVDGTTLRAAALGGPWGRVGASPKVEVELVTALWRMGVTPVVSPIAVDEWGGLVNCNADTVAGSFAGALDAAALVLLSDVDQLRADPLDETSVLASVTEAHVRQLIATGAAREGMRPKMIAALDALEGGATRVLVANGTRPHALRDALSGTIPVTEVHP